MVMKLFYILSVSMSRSWLYVTTVFARCHHWRKLNKGYRLSVLFLITICESVICSEKCVIKKINQDLRIQTINPFS